MLAVTLVIVAVIFGMISTTIEFQESKTAREAKIAAHEAQVLARAARVYVRNLIANSTATDPRLDIATIAQTPTDIPIADLVAENLLPPGFSLRNGNFENALGQPIRLIMANYPIGGDPILRTTVPTAYLYFEEDGNTPVATNPNYTQEITNELRNMNISISSPIYNGTTLISPTCSNGNPSNASGQAVSIWDTSCIDTTEFTALTGDATFTPGSYILPVWKAVNFNQNAVLRFPQPEQGGEQVMQVDLEMGEMLDCVANPAQSVNIRTDTGMTPLPLCKALDDDVSSNIDNRRAILNSSNVISRGLIIDPQFGANDVAVGGATIADNSNDLFIAGLTTVNGDTKVFDGLTDIEGITNVDRGIISASVDVDGKFSADSMFVTATTNVKNAGTAAAPLNVSNLLTADNITADGEIVSSAMKTVSTGTGQSININAKNNLNITQPDGSIPITVTNGLEVTGASTIAGSSYSLATQLIEFKDDLEVINDIDIDRRVQFEGKTTSNQIEVTNSHKSAKCFNCPDLDNSKKLQCQNLANQGIISYSACMAL